MDDRDTLTFSRNEKDVTLKEGILYHSLWWRMKCLNIILYFVILHELCMIGDLCPIDNGNVIDFFEEVGWWKYLFFRLFMVTRSYGRIFCLTDLYHQVWTLGSWNLRLYPSNELGPQTPMSLDISTVVRGQTRSGIELFFSLFFPFD